MRKRIGFLALLGVALVGPPAALMMAQQGGAGRRPQGPCDVYAAGNTPCTAAHSSTRALYAGYNGPLYQVLRQSDGKTLDIGAVQPNANDAGGYADAAAQDQFCANTYCWITTLYDQSGHGNHLIQAPRGAFSGPGLGGYNNLPLADMAPVSVMGHKVYGVFIEPGMGLRWNNARGTAVDDQEEGQYWVVNGHHYNSGCCYDYGNAETDSRDDGDGTMETTYFGNATNWYKGPAPGPWIMSDQENNLVGCVTDAPNNKNCDLPIIQWRFVAATMDGEPHHWRTMGGDAQQGEMKIMYDGKRVQNNNSSYDPMRKQGGILLGNGGDNSNGSQGTFYEGAMTQAKTFPSQETNQKLQANIVSAKYAVASVSVAAASAVAKPNGLQTFAPGSSQETTVTFTNASATPVTGVKLSLKLPAGWTADAEKTIAEAVAPGASVNATFKVTSGPAAFNGDLIANASWMVNGKTMTETGMEKIRNISPIKINEYAANFIELYNAGSAEVDISNWSVMEHAQNQAIFSTIKVPAGTKIAPKGFYLMGLSTSGLAAEAKKGDTTVYVRSVNALNVGDTVTIDGESRKITAVGTAASAPTTLWQPLPDGPIISIKPGDTNVPVTSVAGIEVGQKIGLGYGTGAPAVNRTIEQYEVVTVTEVGKPGTQTALAADAKAGDTSVRIRNSANISAGDKISLDIDSFDHGIEVVTVKAITPPPLVADDAAPAAGRGRGRGPGNAQVVELTAPLKFNHANNMPLSVRGTGITFQPAAKVSHFSNEPVQALGTGITLDRALDNDHAINAPVHNAAATAIGYQGSPVPGVWFGGPTFTNAGVIVLRDAAGLVADSLNYGAHTDPWAGEGYQGQSGGGQSGCKAPSPVAGGGRGRGAPPPADAPVRSAARITDGVDTDSNCGDFQMQTATPGATNQRPQ